MLFSCEANLFKGEFKEKVLQCMGLSDLLQNEDIAAIKPLKKRAPSSDFGLQTNFRSEKNLKRGTPSLDTKVQNPH